MSGATGAAPKTVRVGDFEVDLSSGEVRRGGSATRLQDKPLQLLGLLLEYPNELVTREQIRDRIWGPSRYHDFEDSLNQAVRKLREALQESASEPRLLQTIPRRGYRLIVSAGTSGQHSAATAHPIVGRVRELAELNAAFESASNGRGQLVCISGEPGIGKTTLAGIFLDGLRLKERCRIATGRCSERLTGTEAYLPLLECLENLVREDAQAVHALRTAAPAWFAELPAALAAEPVTEPGLSSQERRKREFVSLLERLSADRPLALLFEDLHWADHSTVDVLSYAASRCGSMRVLLLGTYRPSDLARTGHPFQGAKLELQAHRLCQEIELNALALQEVRAYIEQQFPGNAFPDDFADSICRRTEGSPLFMVDLLRDLARQSVLCEHSGKWVLACPLSEMDSSLPESVRGMVERQIGLLSPEHRRLLEIASVQGSEFQSTIIATAAKLDFCAAEDALADIERQHALIRSRGEQLLPDSSLASGYVFSHILYQNALYAGLRPSRRASLSRAVAAALRQHYGSRENEIAAQLAKLYETAHEWESASGFFTAAAESAAKRSGFIEAVELSEQALALADKLDGEMRLRRRLAALTQLAHARQALSQFKQALSTYEEAAAVAAELRDADQQVQALCSAAFAAGYLKQTEQMRLYASHALDLAQACGSPTAWAESVLAFQALFVGDLERAERQRHAAMSLRQSGPPAARIFAVGSLALLNTMQSEYGAADAALAEAFANMRATNSWSDLLRATWIQGMVLGNQGRFSEAIEALNKGIRVAELNGERYWYSRYPNSLAWVYAELMDPETALRINHEGIRAGQAADTPETQANSHINIASVFVDLSELARAHEHIVVAEHILKREDHKHWLRWRFSIRLELETAKYLIARGDLASAQPMVESALRRAESYRARKHAAAAHKLSGDIAVRQERLPDALREYEAALTILEDYPCPLIEWKVLLAASDACSLSGDRDRAEALLGRCRNVLLGLAASITDERLRRNFVQSERLRAFRLEP